MNSFFLGAFYKTPPWLYIVINVCLTARVLYCLLLAHLSEAIESQE